MGKHGLSGKLDIGFSVAVVLVAGIQCASIASAWFDVPVQDFIRPKLTFVFGAVASWSLAAGALTMRMPRTRTLPGVSRV